VTREATTEDDRATCWSLGCGPTTWHENCPLHGDPKPGYEGVIAHADLDDEREAVVMPLTFGRARICQRRKDEPQFYDGELW